jgi:hypothetical protein
MFLTDKQNFLTLSHLDGGFGGFHLNSPIGGWAKGTP